MFKNREMNMCEGALLKNLIIYALPLMATNILQLLFNAADVAVLGFYAGKRPVAAVGATAALINLIVGLFIGLSVGANVLIARCVGENNVKRSRRIVGMSMILSVVVGVFLAIVGVTFARVFLTWMGCNKNVISLSVIYLRIYFLGMPIIMLYNFCASILRAVGDTVRPLIFLLIGGIVNVGLNLLFITAFKMEVEGVAIATVVSQGVSATLCIITLLKEKGFSKLEPRRIKFYPKELKMMIKIGLPAGLQGCLFALSNVLIQSNINSFGVDVMSANTIAGQLDGFIYNAMNAISLSALAFVSQNLGANNFERIKKTIYYAVGVVVCVGIIVGAIIIAIAPSVATVIAKGDKEVVDLAFTRILLISMTYFTCGIMDVMSNSLRGLGKSTLAMCLTLAGTCIFRIIYINTVCKIFTDLFTLYMIYPVSWIFSIALFIVAYIPAMRQVKAKIARNLLESPV